MPINPRCAPISVDRCQGRRTVRSRIILNDNLEFLSSVPDSSFDLIYIDPPFNTGRVRELSRLKTIADPKGDRIGFQGKTYRTKKGVRRSYYDQFDDYIEYLFPRLKEARRVLSERGSFFLHIDYREAHYAKVALDEVFGRSAFMNEIIWAYDYGGRSKARWPAKHDTIFWYVADPGNYTFNYEEIDRIPYMAPSLVTKEKAERGKTPTDVWWHTIVPTNGRERTGYPTQKPLGIINRIITVHSRRGDHILDFYCGSGTTGESAARNGRYFTLVDNNIEAVMIAAKRLQFCSPVCVGFETSFSEPFQRELLL